MPDGGESLELEGGLAKTGKTGEGCGEENSTFLLCCYANELFLKFTTKREDGSFRPLPKPSMLVTMDQ